MHALYLDDCALAALAQALERVALEAQLSREARVAALPGGGRVFGGCAAPAACAAGTASPLRSSVLPSISVHDYVRRIHRHFRCSGLCLYFAFAYILRLAQRPSPLAEVSEMSIHRLFLCGTVVAAKVLDDRYYSNKYYARVGGVRLASLNSAELCFLKALDYRALVSEGELEEAMALSEPVAPEDEVCSVSSVGGLALAGAGSVESDAGLAGASPPASPAASPRAFGLRRDLCAGSAARISVAGG